MIGSARKSTKRSTPRYWLNFNGYRVKLHKANCIYIRKGPMWKEFSTETDAYAATDRAVQKCGYCWID